MAKQILQNSVIVDALTKKDMTEYYQYSINEAADKLGCCATVLKKRCRELGIQRWPHRAYMSLIQLQDDLLHADLNLQKKEKLAKKVEDGLEIYNTNPNVKLEDIIKKYEINIIKQAVKRSSAVNDAFLNQQEATAASSLVELSSPASISQYFVGSPYGFFSLEEERENNLPLSLQDHGYWQL